LVPDINEIVLGLSSSIKVKPAATAVVRPLEDVGHSTAGLSVRVSGFHASDVTVASLLVDLALSETGEFAIGSELLADHDLSLFVNCTQSWLVE